MNGDFVFLDECVPGIRWDAKYATWDNFTGKPVDGYLVNRVVGTNLQAIFKDERAGDVKDSQADISKAKALLGYTPSVGLEEGLRHTLDWCRAESAAAAGR